MAIFANVIPLVISNEGGDNEVKDDKGGRTKFGLSSAAYPNIDFDKLTIDDALVILKKDYWDKYNLSHINNQIIANQIFLLVMNMNPDHAIPIIQISINACGQGNIKIKVDAILGQETINAINHLADGWLSNRIRLEAIHYYLMLTDKDSTQIKFFRGWVRRALSQ